MSTATTVPVATGALDAEVVLPSAGHGLIIFAHGSGSSRHSARNGHVARVLQQAGLGTVLVDLLTPGEVERDRVTEEYRYDIPLLGRRASEVVAWATAERLADHPAGIGLFGASTGAAAALIAAAAHPAAVGAVVCRGGRADLVDEVLPRVEAPVLLIAGSHDAPSVDIAADAMVRLGGRARLHVIPGATHLFGEPGAIDEVAELSREWFVEHLGAAGRT